MSKKAWPGLRAAMDNRWSAFDENAPYAGRFYRVKEGKKLAAEGYAVEPAFGGRVYLAAVGQEDELPVKAEECVPGYAQMSEEEKADALHAVIADAVEETPIFAMTLSEYEKERYETYSKSSWANPYIVVGGNYKSHCSAAVLSENGVKFIQARTGSRTFFVMPLHENIVIVTPENSGATLKAMREASDYDNKKTGYEVLGKFVLYYDGEKYEAYDAIPKKWWTK